MKILIGADAAPSPDSGAAGTVVATNLALQAMGHEVDAFWHDDLAHRIKHWNLHYWLELPREYRRVVAQRSAQVDYDVIQLSQPYAWLAARDNQRRGCRAVFVNRSHGLECMADTKLCEWHQRLGVPQGRYPWLSALLRGRVRKQIDRVVRYSDGMIVPAQEIKDHLIAHHGATPERVAVIHHGVPEPFLRHPVRPMDAVRLRRMLCVGQYSFIKGPQLLALSVTQVLQENPQASFSWVCSKGHHAEVRALFPEAVHSRVQLLDWMAQEQLIEVYDSHGVCMAHSLYEGAAKACTEAMARGLVLISSAVGAVKDHVRQDVNGYCVNVGDSETMAKLALSVMAHLPRAVEISDAARRTSVGLSWAACAEQAVDFYQELLSRREKH
ncbi:MAG: glycosyltransferase family 4 protein [Thermomonas sp.]|uniref:glycosyltransferase family 4 protein n=1 Tax=Thermomonas sp. TaxID=1971895 RepID=UPI00260326C7|nr:glycosyltransferase family 4 protein [Thermomonas sp.]MCC7096255.1 glycosyltransferase family 4 protein [Thermomonas sp.]